MYGFDIGIHVGENIRETERKEKAQAAEARSKARAAAKARAQEQADAQARAQAQVQDQGHGAHTAQVQAQPQAQSADKSQKQKPGPLMMPFNVFQDQVRKGSPVSSLQPPPQRPGGPNRAMSFPNFPTGFPKPPSNGSGLNSLANSAYNSPLPSPGLSGPAMKAFFPFAPKTDSGSSNNPSPK